MDPYDEVAWEGGPDPLTHPARLAVQVLLDGRAPRDPLRGRLLELGCAEGAHLLPLAFHHPQLEVVGVERSAAQAARAAEDAAALGLENLRVVHADLAEVDPESLGEFDAISAHGMLSWAPPEVGDAMLSLIAACLRPDGVAHVSFNARPGWALRGELREAMLAFAGEGSARERVGRARAGLDTLARLLASPETSYQALLAEQVAEARDSPDAYLLHEYLGAHNTAWTLDEVVARAAERGLRFVGELARASADGIRSLVVASELVRSGASERAVLRASDLLLQRRFRRAAFARADAPGRPRRLADALDELHLCARFRAPDGAVDLGDGVEIELSTDSDAGIRGRGAVEKAALLALSERPFGTMSVVEIVEAAVRRLRAAGLRGDGPLDPDEASGLRSSLATLIGTGHVHAYAAALRPVDPGDGPWEATALARLEADRHDWATDRMHRAIPLSPPQRALIGAMDGPLDRGALASRWSGAVERLEATLRRFEAAGLISSPGRAGPDRR